MLVSRRARIPLPTATETLPVPASSPFDPRAPLLRSERCLLGIPSVEGAGAVLDYYLRNREHLEPWEPARPTAFYSPAFWEAHLRHNFEDFRQGTSFRAVVTLQEEPGRVVGAANLSNIARGVFLSCHLGYSFDGPAGGQGLATEAVGRLVQHAFEGLGLHRVQAAYIPENVRSERLLTRLGFEREGLAEQYLFIGGAWRDHVLTARRAPGAVRPILP